MLKNVGHVHNDMVSSIKPDKDVKVIFLSTSKAISRFNAC